VGQECGRVRREPCAEPVDDLFGAQVEATLVIRGETIAGRASRGHRSLEFRRAVARPAGTLGNPRSRTIASMVGLGRGLRMASGLHRGGTIADPSPGAEPRPDALARGRQRQREIAPLGCVGGANAKGEATSGMLAPR